MKEKKFQVIFLSLLFYSEEAAYDYTLSHDDRGYNQQPAFLCSVL
jgi:hypothetical protein